MGTLPILRPGRFTPFQGMRRPRWPWRINRDSPQSDSLVAWWPLANVPFFDGIDLVNGGNFTLVNQGSGSHTGATWQGDVQHGTVPSFTRTDTSNGDYMEIDKAIVTGVPFTLSIWFNTSLDSSGQAPFSLQELGGAGNQWFNIQVRTDITFRIFVQTRASSQAEAQTAGGGFVLNEWRLATGVWAGTADRRAFLDDGKDSGTNTTDLTPTNIDRTTIGRIGDSSPSGHFVGQLADARVWNRALTNDEVFRLFDPKTRYDLYYETGKVFYSFNPFVPGPVPVGRKFMIFRQ